MNLSKIKPTTNQLIKSLQSANEDFEWYPTTKEMLNCIFNNISKNKEKLSSYNRSLLDIGAGNGKALEFISKKYEELLKGQSLNLYSIEKSQILYKQQSEKIIPIGSDFMEQTLIDKNFSIIFSNPPYSIYEQWAEKIIRESQSEIIYLILPKRWKKSKKLKAIIKYRNFKKKVIGKFSFENSEDRKARAKIHIIKFMAINIDSYCSLKKESTKNAFELWFEQTFPTKKDEKDKAFEEMKEKLNEIVVAKKGSIIEIMTDSYQKELATIQRAFESVMQIEPSLLKKIDISIEKVAEYLKKELEDLKNKYWYELFNRYDPITKRLTSSSIDCIYKIVCNSKQVDFNAQNIYQITLYVIKQANKYIDEQTINTYIEMMSDLNAEKYKSNENPIKFDRWSSESKKDYKNRAKLTYRVVMSGNYGIMDTVWRPNELSPRGKQLLSDILVIAKNLGFEYLNVCSIDQLIWHRGKEMDIKAKYKLDNNIFSLMKVRAFKNGNFHIKFNESFINALNIEAGRLLGWLRDKTEAQHDLNLNKEEINKYYKENEQQKISNNNVPLLINKSKQDCE